METGRVTRKVLDYIADINKEAKQMQLSKDLKKEAMQRPKSLKIGEKSL